MNKKLLVAAGDGNLDIVRELLKNGAYVNAKNNVGETALIKASEKGHKDIVDLLLAWGADWNVRTDDEGYAPLHSAASSGHKDIVDLLLERGASVETRDFYSRTPLHYAAAGGQRDVVELLLTKYSENLNAPDYYDKKPLYYAAGNGHKDVVELLRQHGGQG